MFILIILIQGFTAAFGFNYILVLYQATIYACIHVKFVHHVLYTIWLCTQTVECTRMIQVIMQA
jgi:hypothetical protein